MQCCCIVESDSEDQILELLQSSDGPDDCEGFQRNWPKTKMFEHTNRGKKYWNKIRKQVWKEMRKMDVWRHNQSRKNGGKYGIRWSFSVDVAEQERKLRLAESKVLSEGATGDAKYFKLGALIEKESLNALRCEPTPYQSDEISLVDPVPLFLNVDSLPPIKELPRPVNGYSEYPPDEVEPYIHAHWSQEDYDETDSD
ncbi:uncharacterized protein LOC131937491 [Physella acuta]|uniref:uncharacterized protein LOC131937491 n=1 Tax=Physella acuta TaxID=109671 RepID=UPI0027DD4954|nr:uncharacterized protein LOC131937491 [Physella acuta]